MRQTTRRILWLASVLICGGVLLAVLLMFTGCGSTVKVDPAKSEATRTVDGGETVLRAKVWPKGEKPQ